jgi:hypothetical protein
MYVTSELLRDQVIRPTLEYMCAWTSDREEVLLDVVLNTPDMGLFSARNEGLGLFHITSAQHRDLWDRYLAFNPDLASKVRGLASQRAFMSDPDSELQTNLSYCTAIAWLMYQRAGGSAKPSEALSTVASPRVLEAG